MSGHNHKHTAKLLYNLENEKVRAEPQHIRVIVNKMISSTNWGSNNDLKQTYPKNKEPFGIHFGGIITFFVYAIFT